MGGSDSSYQKLSGRIVLACHSLSGDLWFDDHAEQIVIVSPNELIFRKLLNQRVACLQDYVRGVISDEAGRENVNIFSAGWLNSRATLLPDCYERMPGLQKRGIVEVDAIRLDDLLAALHVAPPDPITFVIDMIGDTRKGLAAAATALSGGYNISSILVHLAVPSCHEGGLDEGDVRDWVASSGRHFDVQAFSDADESMWMRLDSSEAVPPGVAAVESVATDSVVGFQIRYFTADDIEECLKLMSSDGKPVECRAVEGQSLVAEKKVAGLDTSASDATLKASRAREVKALSDLAAMKRQYYDLVTHAVELEGLLAKAIGFVPEDAPVPPSAKTKSENPTDPGVKARAPRSPRKRRAKP